METEILSKMDYVTVQAELETAAPGTIWPQTMESTLKVVSASKPTSAEEVSTSEAYLNLASGGMMYINANTQSGIIQMNDGSKFSVGQKAGTSTGAPFMPTHSHLLTHLNYFTYLASRRSPCPTD